MPAGPLPQSMENDIATWLRLVRTEAVDAPLRKLHQLVFDETAQARPICAASGRCCAFREFGHELFVTGLEAAWTWTQIVERPTVRLTIKGVEESRCPLLAGMSCGAHLARPTPCRVFFCDRASSEWSAALAERVHSQVRHLHQKTDAPYVYARFTALLQAFAQHSSSQQLTGDE